MSPKHKKKKRDGVNSGGEDSLPARLRRFAASVAAAAAAQRNGRRRPLLDTLRGLMPRSSAPHSASIPQLPILNKSFSLAESNVENESSRQIEHSEDDKNDEQKLQPVVLEPNILPQYSNNETYFNHTSQENLTTELEMEYTSKLKTSNTFKPNNIPLILEENEETEELYTTLNSPNKMHSIAINDTLSSSSASELQRGGSEASGITNALEIYTSCINEIPENEMHQTENLSISKINVPNSLTLPDSIQSNEPLEARKSPVTVQEWIDSLPLENNDETEQELPPNTNPEELDDHHELCLGAEAGLLPSVTIAPPPIEESTSESIPVIPSSSTNITIAKIGRESSLQSDVTSDSHCSSVESLLEARRCDPEEILLGLGFGGPSGPEDTPLSRIPKRFLQPSRLKGVALEDFLKEQEHQAFDPAVWGYRGLTGPAHKPSDIVAKIIERLRERETLCSQSVSSFGSAVQSSLSSISAAPGKFSAVARRVLTRTSLFVNKDQQQLGNITESVLNNVDNRKFVAAQQDANSDREVTRSRRMILGLRSYTLHGDGEDLELESTPPSNLHREDSTLSSTTSATSLTSIESSAGRNEGPSYENHIEVDFNSSNTHRKGSLKRQPCIEESFDEINIEAPEPFTAILTPPEPPPPPQPPPNQSFISEENNTKCYNEVQSQTSPKNLAGSDELTNKLSTLPPKELTTLPSDCPKILSNMPASLENLDINIENKISESIVPPSNYNISIDSNSNTINQISLNSPIVDDGEITPTLQEDSGLSSPEGLERFGEENVTSISKTSTNTSRNFYSSCSACSQRPQLEALRSALNCFSSTIFSSDEGSDDSTRILIAEELRKAANLLERPGAERAAGIVLEQVSFLLHHQSEMTREMANLEQSPSSLIVSQSSSAINSSFTSLRLETSRLAAQVARNTRELTRLRLLLSQKSSDTSPELDN